MTILFFVLALPIFPVRLQTSIFGASELNFRVRNGNGWTLTAINTNLLSYVKESISNCAPFVKQKVVTRTGIEPMFAA